MIEIQEITQIEELVKIKNDWDSFIINSKCPSQFLLFEYFYSWWENFGQSHDVLILVFRLGGGIITIMPLIKEKKYFLGYPIHLLRAMCNDQTFYYDILFKNNIEEIIVSLKNYLKNKKVSFIDFGHLSTDSQLLNSLRDEAKIKRGLCFFEGERSFACPYIEIKGSWSNFWDSLSPLLTKAIDRKERKIQKLGSLNLRELANFDINNDNLNEAFEIEAMGWKKESGTAIKCEETVKNFYIDFCNFMAKRGTLRLLFLELDCRKIAFELGMEQNNIFYALKIGYDSEFAKHSPGNLLRKKLLMKIFKEKKINKYDFLGSFNVWKREWTSSSVEFKRVVIFDWSFTSLFGFVIAKEATILVKYTLKRLKCFFKNLI